MKAAQAALTKKLEEWQKHQVKANKINADANGQLEDLLVTFEKKAEPINSERDRQLGPILLEMQRLEDEIRHEMLRHVKSDGTIEIAQVETKLALAQVTIDRKREIDAAQFLRSVPPSRRQDPGFFGCISVLIGKAEKFLDKPTMDRLTRLKLTPSVAVTLKSE